jgi:hypothetical protein
MLLPFLYTSLADLVSISQARRAAGFLPFAFAFAGGMGVLARLVGPILLPLMLGAGMFLQIVYPGDFDYVLKNPAPAWIAWFAVIGAVAALVLGFVRRRPALETGAALASAAFLTPVIGGGLLDWRPPPPPAIATLSGGLVDALRDEVRPGEVVFSDPETSFRLAAFAPVYIASAPPGHVADTEKNRPYERARDARRFLRTGDLRIPEEYGAEYVVVDSLRTKLELDLPVVYRDGASPCTGSRQLDAPQPPPRRLDEDVAGLEVEIGDREPSPFKNVRPPGRPHRPSSVRSNRRRCEREGGSGSRILSSRTTPSPPR